MSQDRRASKGSPASTGQDDLVPYEGRDDAPTERLATAPSGSAVLGPAGRGRPDAGGTTGRTSPPRPPRQDPRAASQRPARRRAKLALTRVDPWSVFLLSLILSICLGIVLVVAVVVLYALVNSLGALDAVNDFAREIEILDEGQSLVSGGQVFGVAALLAAVDVVLLTVLATLGAFLYNVCASLTGGVEVVLGERE